MNTFSARLREERQRLDLNQTEFAELAGVLKGAQVNYEAGKRAPDAIYMAAIAAAGADVRYILTGERDGPIPLVLTAEEQTMLDYFREASKEVRRAALGALLGAAAPSQQVGGAYSQHNVGDNAVQIGSGGSSKVTIKKGR